VKRHTLAAFAVLITSQALAADFPVEGSYGFDWLQPQTTSCRRITRDDAKRFSSCEFSASGNAFGLPSSYHKCAVSPRCPRSSRSEFFIYASREGCQEALETMQSNGP
jgi:hypothetical protein